MELAGYLIRAERLRRGWSQDGLCRGICAASYLSKLEQGKAQASEEIVRQLFARLDLSYDAAPEVCETLDVCREALFSGANEQFATQFQTLLPQADTLRRSVLAADFLLLNAFYNDETKPLEAEIEPFLTQPQLAMQRALQLNFSAALALDPQPFYRMMEGVVSYRKGGYAAAVESLQRAYTAASEQGLVPLMLLCRVYLGNCYSDQGNCEQLRMHYTVALRLAKALGDHEMLRAIDYNIYSSALEQGDIELALRYFASLSQPTVMELHKLAICYEKLGQTANALRVLDDAELLCADDTRAPLAREMLALVRFRAAHPNYLHLPEYGALLCQTFEQIRETRPMGYTRFHLPWMLEWYQASRQYRQAFHLLKSFP